MLLGRFIQTQQSFREMGIVIMIAPFLETTGCLLNSDTYRIIS